MSPYMLFFGIVGVLEVREGFENGAWDMVEPLNFKFDSLLPT